MEKMQLRTLVLSVELDGKLKGRAKHLGISVPELIRRMLEAGIALPAWHQQRPEDGDER